MYKGKEYICFKDFSADIAHTCKKNDLLKIFTWMSIFLNQNFNFIS